jgi:feruloyl-CoA synthase
MITWAEIWQQIQAVGAALLEMDLGADRPLMILSGNSIEHAILVLAAEHIGVPVAPVSPAYSLVSKDFARLRDVVSLVPPGAIFVQDAGAFARALDVIVASLMCPSSRCTARATASGTGPP